MPLDEVSKDANAERVGLEQQLRDGLGEGRAPLVILDNWASLDALLDASEDPLSEIVQAAGEIDPAIASAAAAGPLSVGAALVGSKGELREADARFSAWIGDPAGSVGCLRLIRKALAGERVIGLVETDDKGVICLFAVAGQEAFKWGGLLGLPSRDAGEHRAQAVALVAFAPSRSGEAVSIAARAYGFSPLEGRLVEALLDAPSLEAAADKVGVRRGTAKDALEGAMRKAGAATAAQLIGRMMELSRTGSAADASSDAQLAAALGLSPTEARAARALAAGLSAKAVAQALGLSDQTVATYRRTIFAKTGVNRARDLGRLLAEVEGLKQLAGASEVVLDGAEEGRLRLLVDARGRRVAFIDYGPGSGPLVVLTHGSTTGRTVPPPLLQAWRASGRRVVALQRPGFGLSQPAIGDYRETASADLLLLLDTLGAATAQMISRGSLSALEFLARHPDRFSRIVLVNPQPPRATTSAVKGPLDFATRLLLERPALIDPFARMLSRQNRSDLIAGLLRRAASEVEADRRVIDDPALLHHLVRDAQGLIGLGMAGFAAENRLLAGGWRPPAAVTGERVVVVQGGGLKNTPLPQAWPTLTRARFVVVPDAGWWVQFSHPEVLVRLLEEG